MASVQENYYMLIALLREIHTELQMRHDFLRFGNTTIERRGEFLQVPFKGPEIYLLHKAFLDSGGAPNENFKTLLGKTLAGLSNKSHRGFSVDSIYKCSDKVVPEAKENVKRFLQRMIRNIDSYD